MSAGAPAAFTKHRSGLPSDFFRVEAAGLAWLAEPAAIAIPNVLDVGDDFIALERIEPGPRTATTDEELGRGLAALHRAGAPAFGWDRDGYVGDLSQRNQPCPSWSEFYRSRRLEPLVRLGIDRGALPRKSHAEFGRLFERLDELVGPIESAARLHGDLWAGNWIIGSEGRPWLVDPAPYGGHREVDLAMMHLFGGFDPRCFAAYEEVLPPAEGARERIALYQLYPLLVHVNLFGSGYTAQTLAALRTYT